MSCVELNNIWKKYLIEYRRRLSIRDCLLDLFHLINKKNEFWALKDVNLDIPDGQTLGVIGRNGSGKTTLLKLLCGVTKPTRGSLKIHGRVTGLLELGAGFDTNLTGRENIYLNGLILGLTRKEVQRSLEAIIDFADIGDFIDVAVRTYSSGMYLRLGFAITMGLSPDILLIDEVLAVGDEAFQDKCLAKIQEFKNLKKTIIFVSHNLNIVRKLCDRVILMNEGCIINDGKPDFIVERYLSLLGKADVGRLSKEIEIANVHFENGQSQTTNVFKTGESLKVVIEYTAHAKIQNPVFGVGVYRNGQYLIGPNTQEDAYPIDYVEDSGRIVYELPSIPFTAGTYKVSISIHDTLEKYFYDYSDRMHDFSVIPGEKTIKHGLLDVCGHWSKQDNV